MSTPAEETVLPPSDPALMSEVEAFLEGLQGQASLVAPDGIKTAIPDELYGVLVRVAQAMAAGQAVTVAPVSMRLTTSQAAEMLGISRPTLIRLLEDGAIPYDQPRRHRIIRLDDLLAFKRNRDQQRRALLAEMTRQAVADGLYDDRYVDYETVLRQVRHEMSAE